MAPVGRTVSSCFQKMVCASCFVKPVFQELQVYKARRCDLQIHPLMVWGHSETVWFVLMKALNWFQQPKKMKVELLHIFRVDLYIPHLFWFVSGDDLPLLGPISASQDSSSTQRRTRQLGVSTGESLHNLYPEDEDPWYWIWFLRDSVFEVWKNNATTWKISFPSISEANRLLDQRSPRPNRQQLPFGGAQRFHQACRVISPAPCAAMQEGTTNGIKKTLDEQYDYRIVSEDSVLQKMPAAGMWWNILATTISMKMPYWQGAWDLLYGWYGFSLRFRCVTHLEVARNSGIGNSRFHWRWRTSNQAQGHYSAGHVLGFDMFQLGTDPVHCYIDGMALNSSSIAMLRVAASK